MRRAFDHNYQPITLSLATRKELFYPISEDNWWWTENEATTLRMQMRPIFKQGIGYKNSIDSFYEPVFHYYLHKIRAMAYIKLKIGLARAGQVC